MLTLVDGGLLFSIFDQGLLTLVALTKVEVDELGEKVDDPLSYKVSGFLYQD